MAKEKKKALAKAAAASPTTASTQSSWSLDDLFTPQGALLAVGFCFFLSGAFKTLNGLYNEIIYDMREQVLPPHLLSSAELDRIHATLSGDKFAFFGGWRKNKTMLGGMNRALVNGEHIILEEFFDVELATKYRAELKSGHAKGWFKGEGPIPFEATGIDMAAYADVGPAKRCQTFRELHEKGGAFQFKYHAAQPHAEGASATLGVSIDKTPAISRVTRSMRSRSFIDAFGMLLSGQPAPTGFRFNDPTVRVFAPGDYTLLHTDRAPHDDHASTGQRLEHALRQVELDVRDAFAPTGHRVPDDLHVTDLPAVLREELVHLLLSRLVVETHDLRRRATVDTDSGRNRKMQIVYPCARRLPIKRE